MKIVKAVLAQNIGLTRDQLNEIMLKLQSHGERAHDWIKTIEEKTENPYFMGKFDTLCYVGALLARASNIET